MSNPVRTLLALAMALCLIPLQTARAADDAGAKKKIFLLAGGPSHGFGAHDHLSGCHLLAKRLNESNLGVEAMVIQGWPKEKGELDGAAAVIMYCDGGEGHMALTHKKELDALYDRGVGIGCIHYAVEVPNGKPGEAWLKYMGGYFATNWSVNPHWTAKFSKLPQHPVANGVRPFTTNDEWYYNMRFREGMQGVTAILSAVPPDSTRQGKDDAHGGNPEVRKGVGKNQTEHVVWVSENANGSRGFGCTGGHVHWNWAQDDFRKTILNAIVWVAKVDVPKDGVKSSRPTVDELLTHHDEPVPPNFDKEEMTKRIEAMNKPMEGQADAK
jgi:type 1 glutamine amidotransferase